jgi:hypothetical protein
MAHELIPHDEPFTDKNVDHHLIDRSSSYAIMNENK